MIVYHTIEKMPSETAVALGYFDGVHRGHRAVIDRVLEQKKDGLLPIVCTFRLDNTFPPSKSGDNQILTLEDRLDLLESLGIVAVVAPAFSSIQELSPQRFVQEILCQKLKAKWISCGYNYRFGAGGSGTPATLQELCAQEDIVLEVAEEMMFDGLSVSSTTIRAALFNGDLRTANHLLGYRYFIKAPVVTGLQLGRTLGFPTLNQEIAPERIVPRHGVYASISTIEGKSYRSITNIGLKPTIAGTRRPLAETYVMGFAQDVYGKCVKVELVEFLREEEKFHGLEELTAAIRSDVLQRENVEGDAP